MSEKAAETRARRDSIKEALQNQYRAQTIDELKEIQTCLGMVIKARISSAKKESQQKKKIEEAQEVIAQHEALLAAGVKSVFSDAMIRRANVIISGKAPLKETAKSVKARPAKKKTKKKTTKKKASKKR
jgi:hypothetical protein